MSYHRTALLDLIDAYAEFVGFHVSNMVTHIVTEDYNLTDDNLDSQLKWIKEHRVEWSADTEFHVDEKDIQIGLAFLIFLKSIPEDRRCEHDDEEGY